MRAEKREGRGEEGERKRGEKKEDPMNVDWLQACTVVILLLWENVTEKDAEMCGCVPG